MSDIGFYHLTRTGPDAALPGLLARTLKAQERAVVKCGSAERVAAVDAALWEDPEWLPHGTVALGHAELQPIWITHQDEAPNGDATSFCSTARSAESPRISGGFSICSTARTRPPSPRRDCGVCAIQGWACADVLAARAKGVGEEVRKDFFFEKKKQKTFGLLSSALPHTGHKHAKSFWFFFQKELASL